jgi:hypothetical protein
MFGRIRLIVSVVLILITVGFTAHIVAQEEPYAPVIDPANFVEGVNHPYFSLVPGTTYIYQGETAEGIERTEIAVLPDTKLILGIVSTVVRDTVWVNDELVEDTLDWYAQDKSGNVWYMGEATKEYENGVVTSTAGSWEGGVDDAQPGIIMEADPKIGDVYRQEYYTGEAEDMAEITSFSESVSIPFGTFENVLVTREWTPLEPGVAENKYYAPGLGLILTTVVEGGSGRDELVKQTTWETSFTEDADEDTEVPLPETPIITANEALQFAESHLEGRSAHEVELEQQGGIWIYTVEIGADEVNVDAITGEILDVAARGN